jgi:hypothetical protein
MVVVFTSTHVIFTYYHRVVVVILKMETGRNFSMSGINSGHHNLPTYEISLKSSNVEFVRYCGDHFENAKVAFDLFFKPVVSGRLGDLRLHNR